VFPGGGPGLPLWGEFVVMLRATIVAFAERFVGIANI
jgi:hypothetical protein